MLNKLKLNQKGLAISGILYSILVLFLILLFSILALLASSKYTFDKLKNDVIDKLSENTETETLSSCFTFDTSTGTILDYNAESSSCPKDVVIPETIDDVAVKYIGSKSFYNKDLTSVDFSQAIYLKEIEGGTAETGAFASNNITKVKFGTLLNFTTFGGYDFYDNEIAGTLDLRGLPNISKLPTKIFSSNKITGIDFSNNKKLTEIGMGAFYQNKLAGELDLTALKKLKTIGEGAFSGSHNSGYNELTSVKLDGLTNLTKIEKTAFYNNALTDFDFTKLPSLTTIGPFAFSQNNLTKADFSNNANLTTISEEAFYSNAIKTLTFKNNLKLTTIEPMAFYSNVIEGVLDLTGAPNVSLASSSIFTHNQITGVKYNGTILGEQIFANNNFTSIDFNLMPNLTEIYARAFLSNDSLTTVNLEVLKRLKRIGSGAFGHCSLTSIKFPNTLTSIESYAFYSNEIEGVLDFSNIEGSLTIGSLSFFDNSLTNVNLPSSYTLNGGAFNNNNFSAERAHYTQKKTRTLEDGTTHEYIELVSYASNNVDEVTVPAEVESIGDYAYHDVGIKKINLHGEIFKIGNYAMGGNDLGDVIDLSVSPKIETIGTYAFQGTDSLGSSVSIYTPITSTTSNNMTYYDYRTDFSNGISIISGSEGKQLILTGLNKLESIGERAFYSKGISTITGWEDLTALETIGRYAFASNYVATLDFSTLKKLTSIEERAFDSNSRLTSVDFNGATVLTSIGPSAFRDCTSLTTVDFKNLPSLTTIDDYAFRNAPITSDIDFSNSNNLTKIGTYAFGGNRCAGTINLENTSLTSISQYSFDAGTTSKSTNSVVKLPGTLKYISSRAFYGMKIQDIVWPNSLTQIDSYAFSYNSFTNLTLPASVTYIGSSAFSNNNIENLGLTNINTSYGTEVFASNNFTTLDLETLQLRKVASGMFKNNKITDLNIGTKITEIGSDAFYGNRLKEIVIPVNVISIDNNAFKQLASYPWENVVIEYNETVLETRFFSKWTRIGWPIILAPSFEYPEVLLTSGSSHDFEFKEYDTIAKASESGYYKLEVWGAAGANAGGGYGGKGGYSSGYIYLNAEDKLYVNIGEFGISRGSATGSNNYNGGGQGAGNGGDGGGATHIATVPGQLDSLENQKEKVLIVAGGGGGGSSYAASRYAGAGGGLSGTKAEYSSSSYGQPGTQTAGGAGSYFRGSFGLGGSSTTNYSSCAGGGGGWYGGSTAGNGPGGGGSGYISSQLSNAITLDGTNSFASPSGEIQIGHSGVGYARITYVGTSLPSQ